MKNEEKWSKKYILGGVKMKAINNPDQTLEEVVDSLIDLDHPLKGEPLIRKDNEYLKERGDDEFTKKVIIQRLRGELRKYLSRSDIYEMQISYIRNKIEEIEDKFE